MVYIASWDEFVERSVQLFRADPHSSRYAMKYRHCDGKLILNVTDNRECLKFRTDQAQNARKMEKLNNIFFTLMLTYQKHQARNRLSNQHPRKEGEGGSKSLVTNFYHSFHAMVV
ncbi:signal recognition particle 9 kDa protein-like isoform X2 [Musa acuminata AAA Group]|uniref:signal recognition particle 9 kDa protein-like isoform X2 n=1 Tax=Musa acuminata AAA Group TaxID=214697 RepID=UPI0031D70F41